MVQPLEDGRLDEELGTDDPDENRALLPDGKLRLPAAYTYFGQFVDHDITFDPVSSLTRQNDPDSLADFRTPKLDLDSLYGRGPSDQPYLYDDDGVHLATGESLSLDNPQVAGPDLLRAPGTHRPGSHRAMIGDPRNDENKIVSQLQVAFVLFHNAVVDRVALDQPGLDRPTLLKLAQQQVRWHYQWIVLHDFLPRLVGEEVVADVLKEKKFRAPGEGGSAEHTVIRPRLLFFTWEEQPFMPVEFSVAAYRFGHSMARPTYLINDVIPVPVVENAARIPLFNDGPNDTNLDGFGPPPPQWGVQWKYLLHDIAEAPGERDGRLPQPSYKLDATISNPLGHLPENVATAEILLAGLDPQTARSLPVRNLLRGLRLGLPSGQAVARAMGIIPILDGNLYAGRSLGRETLENLADRAPLWFYILKEAELLADSAHLGPVGGRIVAEVLAGLVWADPLSFLSVDATWKPWLTGDKDFKLSDLINLTRPPVSGPPPLYTPVG